MKDLHHVKLYQGESQDILRRPPSFLVKAGTLLICFILVCVIVISKYIFIPDIIQTELVIKRNQISFLTASHDTVIKNVVTRNFLKQGEIVAVYGNDNISDIILLKSSTVEGSALDTSLEKIPSIKLFDKNLESAYNTYVHLHKQLSERQNVPIKARAIELDKLLQVHSQLSCTISNWEQRSTIVSPFDGYLLETSFHSTSFVNKGDTLFKMIPIEKEIAQASFKMHSKYKTILQSHVDNGVLINAGSENIPFKVFGIKNLQQNGIEVYININPALLAYFYPGQSNTYVLPVQVSINHKSIFDQLISCISGIL